MKTKTLLYLLGVFFFFSCENSPVDDIITPPVDEEPIVENPLIEKAIFTGSAQKGPFVNGSSVLISELDEELNQTGKVYSTRIADNAGNFEQKNIRLVSPYVELKADGYYFNEVKGVTSSGQVTLYALVDVNEVSSANVNVITHLEKARVEYLVQQGGLTFREAKEQAVKEILNIFSFELPETNLSESLDLTDNAALLAISCILQSYSTTAEMIQLMADISSDIRTDGTLDNSALGSKLIDNARVMISLPTIRENIEKKYAEINPDVIIPDFETYVQEFIDKTTYEPVRSFITYPETGLHGQNILSDSKITTVERYKRFSLKAEVPEGMSLKIIIKDALWYRGDMVNWADEWRKDWDGLDYPAGRMSELEFNVIESGKTSDALLVFQNSNGIGNTIIEYYENGATEPTRVKQVAGSRSEY